jgi:hypothetical protein
MASTPNVTATLLGTTGQYTITEITLEGFTITLLENPGTDATFSWIALENVAGDSTTEVGGAFEQNSAPNDTNQPQPATNPEPATDSIPLVSSSQ